RRGPYAPRAGRLCARPEAHAPSAAPCRDRCRARTRRPVRPTATLLRRRSPSVPAYETFATSAYGRLSGERRTTPCPHLRTVVRMTNFDSTVDRPVSEGPARWSIAGRFLEGLTSRDYERLA